MHDALLQLQWRMLSTLGTPARARAIHSTAVDPECVVILGAVLAPGDARIHDATLHLLHAADRLLSLSRAKRIVDDWGRDTAGLVGNLVAESPGTTALRPWGKAFPPASDSARTHASRQGRTSRADLGPQVRTEPGAFRLRVRAALGGGAHIEALAHLAIWARHDASWHDVREIATLARFSPQHVREGLLDAAAVQFVDHRRISRSHEFRGGPQLLEPAGPVPSLTLDWVGLLGTLVTAQRWRDRIASSGSLADLADAARDLESRTDGTLPPPTVSRMRTDPAASFPSWADQQIQHACDAIS